MVIHDARDNSQFGYAILQKVSRYKIDHDTLPRRAGGAAF